MPKASDLLRVMELERSLGYSLSEGSCFGVSDPSRLRDAFRPEPAVLPKEHLCSSCREGQHNCTGVVTVFSIRAEGEHPTGEGIYKTSSREVPCECRRCHPTEEDLRKQAEAEEKRRNEELEPPF